MTDAAAGTYPGIDTSAVTRWMVDTIPEVTPPLRFDRAGHGFSNLTYRVTDAAGRLLVVRRPPVGPLLPSAHDVGREHRILSALVSTGIPVPRPRGMCTDIGVTGAPFFVMDHCQGLVIADRSAGLALDEPARHAAALSLVRVLAGLHAVDVEAVGLGDLGRHDGYGARQVRRWNRQWERSKTAELPAIDRVGTALEATIPLQRDVAIVHGDYRLDNVIVDHAGEVRAVLDWELCTLGDPLADLGLLLVYWAEAGETTPAISDLATTLPGFPSRQGIVDAYAAVSGRDLSALGYYRTLGYWKLAIIVQGVYRRWLDNPANGRPGASELGASVAGLAERAATSAIEAGLL